MLVSATMWAHSPTETHSTLSVQDGAVVLRLELPWTIADAVKHIYPQINTNTSRQDFFEFVKLYLESNIVLSEFDKPDSTVQGLWNYRRIILTARLWKCSTILTALKT